MEIKNIIEDLSVGKQISDRQWEHIIANWEKTDFEWLFGKARKIQKKYFGNKIYVRGLIELTNYCKNNCLYCGIRRDNKNIERYRLSENQILSSCKIAYDAGFRTFVLQGGEDPFFTEERVSEIVRKIKAEFNDCAVTLSLGERVHKDYEKWKNAGADRYLLRHETALEEHYDFLHGGELGLKSRLECIDELRKNDYQTGIGFMVGSPGQSIQSLAKDMIYIYEFQPEMVGVGPFLPHKDTPFGKEKKGDLLKTLFFIALIRIAVPGVMIPATTALATLSSEGRKKGILAGANVIMPNISPVDIRDSYKLYDNKVNTGLEAVEGIEELRKEMKSIGYDIACVRGDYVR